MRKLISQSVLPLIALSLWIGTTHSELSAQNDMQIASFNQLMQIDTTVTVRWDIKTGTPVRLSGKLSERIEADAKEIAMHFLKDNEVLFSMTNSEKELTVTDVKKGARGWEHVRLQQVYKTLPVEGRTILVHINDNKEVQVVTGDYLPNIDLDTLATILSTVAIRAATQNLNSQMELNQDPQAELIVYNHNDKTYLAWKTRLNSEEPLGEFVYYIDAHTGEIINFYNDLQFIRNRKTYDGNNGTLMRSEGDPPVNDRPLDNAHDYAGSVYDYYNVRHGRDSYDDAGATIKSTVHYGVNLNNAYWSSSTQQLLYGDGDGIRFDPLSQSKDIVAHELTHAVTEKTSKLIYQYQSGALNESLSDIFGVLIDPPDWMLGEDVFTPGTPGDALRYIDDPPRGGQPDHMNDYVVTTGDNGGVHSNSGIPNKAAYLMSEGGTHHGISVLGMGRTNIGMVFYEAQVNWLRSSSNFLEAREATLDAVAAIFPGDISKYNTVHSAWYAVGIGPPPGGWTLQLSPSPFNVGKNGKTKELKALVTNMGIPIAGATVNFSSSNTSRATVSPASDISGPDGRVIVMVTGHDRGNTIISSTATDGTNFASATTPVKVPTTSGLGLTLLIVLLGIMFLISIKKTVASTRLT